MPQSIRASFVARAASFIAVAVLASCGSPTTPQVIEGSRSLSTTGVPVVTFALLGGFHGAVTDINDQGLVSGWGERVGGSRTHAFLWTPEDGTMLLDDLSPTDGYSLALALNGAGQVVGEDRSGGGAFHAVLWTTIDDPTDLTPDLPPQRASRGADLNAGGSVAGSVTAPTGDGGVSVQPFFWSAAGGLRELGTLGGPSGSADGLNDGGMVVGSADRADGSHHAFVWTEGSGMVDIGTLGGTRSHASAVNNQGWVVGGSYTDASNRWSMRAFLWTQEAGMADLGTLHGWGGVTVANDVNDRGQVVGVSRTRNGDRAFLWTPEGGLRDLGTVGTGTSTAIAVNESGQALGMITRPDGPPLGAIWTLSP